MVSAGKPRPNGNQGGALHHPLFPPTRGGRPADRAPGKSTNDCHPMKSPGSGTHGTGNKATPPKN